MLVPDIEVTLIQRWCAHLSDTFKKAGILLEETY